MFTERETKVQGQPGLTGPGLARRSVWLPRLCSVYNHPSLAEAERVPPATPPFLNFNLFEANLSLHLPHPRLLPSELNADQLPPSDSAEAF